MAATSQFFATHRSLCARAHKKHRPRHFRRACVLHKKTPIPGNSSARLGAFFHVRNTERSHLSWSASDYVCWALFPAGMARTLTRLPVTENHSHAQPHLGVLCTARLASPSPRLIIPTARDCHPRRTLRAAPRHDGITAGAWYSWAQAGRSSIQVCCRASSQRRTTRGCECAPAPGTT